MSDTTTTYLQDCFARLNAGDARARDELIRRSCDQLRRLTQRITQDCRHVQALEDVNDVTQGAASRLVKALEVVPIESAAAFFRLAALQIRNELLDLVQRSGSPEGTATHDASSPNASTGASAGTAEQPETTADPGYLAFWTALHERIDTLPADERDVFGLLWYQGLSQQEAADVLGVPVATIKRRWTAARMRLGEALGRTDSNPG